MTQASNQGFWLYRYGFCTQEGRVRRTRALGPRLRRHGGATLLAMLLGMTIPSFAWADEADTLLEDGKKLMKDKKYGEACPKLEQSHKLSPKASTLLVVAQCHEKEGKIATAWSEYLDLGADARKEGNKKLENQAKAAGAKLELKLPRLTVKVPPTTSVEGFELKIDGKTLDSSAFGQARPIDPGEHKLTASAPGHKSREQSVTIKVAEKKAVTVQALEKDASGAAAPQPVEKPVEPATAAPPKPIEKPIEQPPQEVPEPVVTTHQGGRFVVDVGFGGAPLLGIIDKGSVSGIETLTYEYIVRGFDGQLASQFIVCGSDHCDALYDPAIGAVVGGQAFVGYAVSEKLHLGGRFFGGYRFGGGYLLVGGPAGAYHLDFGWVGLSLLVGGVGQNAKLIGVKGEVPEDARQFNKNMSEVDVPTAGTNTPEFDIVSTLAFGGAIEVSYVLVDNPGASWTSGALVVSAWPTFLKGLSGFAISLPVTLGYRFH